MKITRHALFAMLAATSVTAALAAVRPAHAQERTTTWTPHEKARIGVLLEEHCEVTAIAEDQCQVSPVVTSVVVNGPADLAGVTSGDTLLAIDGLSLTSVAGRTALLSLEEGVTVELELARQDGHLSLEVTPELRGAEPYVDVRTMRFGPAPDITGIEGEMVNIRVVRIPSVRSRLDEVEIRLDSLRTRTDGFVFFHQDSAGTFTIEVGDRERGVRAAIPGYVWENEELAQRLAKVRESALHSARVHLDSLVRLRRKVHIPGADSLDFAFSSTAEADPDGGWAYFVGPRRVSGQVRTLFLTDFRVAGAEFRELQGDLAEYFEGADRGLLVIRVIPDTPAARTGLREGDVVVEVNGKECHQISTLRAAVAEAGPSGELQVVWVRKGDTHTGRLGVD